MIVRVVEDSPEIGGLLKVMLAREEGLQIRYTGSGFESLLTPHPWKDVDAALVDLMLSSSVTGKDILRYLKGEFPGIRRVVLTAVEPLDKSVTDYADAILLKPASSTDIAQALRGVPNGG